MSISREEALQNADDADEEERVRKVKRRAPDDGEALDEAPAGKRRKVAWNKAEERIKLKRTVFVGNLPVNCSKKVTEPLRRNPLQVQSFWPFFFLLSCFFAAGFENDLQGSGSHRVGAIPLGCKLFVFLLLKIIKK